MELSFQKKLSKLLLIFLLLTSLNTYAQQDTTSVLNKFISEWLGRPYKLGGKTEKGIDCSQFTKRLYKDVFNLILPDVAYKQWNATKRILKGELIIGDIVFFRSKSSPSGWHCGIYIGDDKFIHASNKYEGVKISILSDPKYTHSYRGAGRL
jgi:cell wall-associated NlpC family hydrolase